MARKARKRRQHAAGSDESYESEDSDATGEGISDEELEGSDEEWTVPTDSLPISSSESSSRIGSFSIGSTGEELYEDELSTSARGQDDGDISAPLTRTQFDSWESFHDYIRDYSASTYQSFRVRTTTNVTDRNKKIAPGSVTPHVPNEWGFYNKTLVCTHGGEYNPRGKGKRQRQETRKIKCNAKINACVRVVNNRSDDPIFALCVTSARLQHNHPLKRATYRNYPSVRTAIPAHVSYTVNDLRKAGAKRKSILQYIHDNTDCNMNMRDVHNLIRKLKEQESPSTSSAHRLKRWMMDFCESPGNVGRIFVAKENDKKVAACITMQTKFMRDMFHRFPEVMLIDATHGTNASKYKIFSFMVHDAFGKGQFVQHAVLQNERAPTLLTAIEEFKKNNSVWSKLKCVIVDKDFTEMSVLKIAFPEARVLLCHFHVIKYLHEQVASSEYNLSVWQKSQLRSVVRLMVRAKTEREFNMHREFARHIIMIGMHTTAEERMRRQISSAHGAVPIGGAIASDTRQTVSDGHGTVSDFDTGSDAHRDGLNYNLGESARTHPFETYLLKNWDSCKSMWAGFARQNAVTLGNNTNNRLESSWKQLKDTMSPSMGLDECVASVMCFQERNEKLFESRANKIGLVFNAKYDREMSIVVNLVSEHACELIFEQYSYAISGAARYSFHEAVPGLILIQSTSEDDNALDEPRAEYSVNKKTWECSCLFMTTRLLPCRHVLFLRKALQMESIIPTRHLPERWVLATLRNECSVEDLPGEAFAIDRVIREEKKPWDSNRKYREAQAIASTIAETMSCMGMKQYRAALHVLQEIGRKFKHGESERLVSSFSAQAFSVSERESLLPAAEQEEPLSAPSNRTVTGDVTEPEPPAESETGMQQVTVRAVNASDDIAIVDSLGFGQHFETIAAADPPTINGFSSDEDQSYPSFSLSVFESSSIPLAQGEPLSAQSETVNEQSAQSETVNEQSAQSETVNEQSAQSETVNEQSAQSETVNKQSAQSETVNEQSDHLVQSGAVNEQSDHPLQSETAIVQTVPSGTGLRLHRSDESDFEVVSPPKSRGRPKAKPKVTKRKTNTAIARAQEDSEMHNLNLSLATIADVLSGEPTYESAASTLAKFKLFVFEKKTKPPTAHEIVKLPLSKPLISADEVVRVFGKALLRTCDSKVTALQRSKPGLAERDVALEVPGVGVFPTAILAIMKSYHRAIDPVRLIEKAIKWISAIEFDLPITPPFTTEVDSRIQLKLQQLNLLKNEVHLLDITRDGRLSDDTMNFVMKKLFASNPDVIIASPNMLWVEGGSKFVVSGDWKGLAAIFYGASREKVLIPVNCNNSHWCSIMVNLQNSTLDYYDPMDSTYKSTIRSAVQRLTPIIPQWRTGGGRVKLITSGIGSQRDNHSCGIYILVQFEIFVGAPSPGDVRNKLDYLRYRYLCMCL